MTPLDALYRMRRAWEASSPQLVFDNFWPDSGLDEQESRALLLVEPVPAASPYPPSGGGLETRLTAGESLLPGVASTDATAGPRGAAAVAPGLDGRRSPAVSRVLNRGAEPCRDLLGTDGKSSLFTAPAPAWAGSAPPTNQTAADRAYPPKSAHGRRQEVTL